MTNLFHSKGPERVKLIISSAEGNYFKVSNGRKNKVPDGLFEYTLELGYSKFITFYVTKKQPFNLEFQVGMLEGPG